MYLSKLIVIMQIMKPKDINMTELEEKAKTIDGIFNESLVNINKLEKSAILIFKNIRLKREKKKIEDLRNELLN